jgi:hypothetical protein
MGFIIKFHTLKERNDFLDSQETEKIIGKLSLLCLKMDGSIDLYKFP